MFGPISLVHPQTRYLRMPPHLLDAKSKDGELLAWFYKQLADREAICLPHGYFQVSGCYVSEGAYVLSEEEGWLEASVDNFNARHQILPTLLDLITKRHAQTLDVDGLPVVVIGAPGFDNHGHVLTDIIPKLVNVQRAGLGEIALALPEAMEPYLESIRIVAGQLGISARYVLLPHGRLFRMESAYFMAPISKHNTIKSLDILVMRDILLGAYGARKSRASLKLFVARKESERRHIANRTEVDHILDEFGFEKIHPADFSLPEQVRLFARASHIIGVLGAGLANIVFAPCTTKVMVLDPGLMDFYFWDLAALLGQHFTWLFAGEIASWSLERAGAPFEVDPMLLRAALRRF